MQSSIKLTTPESVSNDCVKLPMTVASCMEMSYKTHSHAGDEPKAWHLKGAIIWYWFNHVRTSCLSANSSRATFDLSPLGTGRYNNNGHVDIGIAKPALRRISGNAQAGVDRANPELAPSHL